MLILIDKNLKCILNEIRGEMDNKDLIESFYRAFSERNAESMINCYHDDIEFEDPAFGILKGERAKYMWKMLLSNDDTGLEIKFANVSADELNGSATWQAKYFFGSNKRKVINDIKANFTFKDGKIVKHKDTFNIWKWSGQALGMPGWLLGWTPFMQSGIRKKTNFMLDKFIDCSP